MLGLSLTMPWYLSLPAQIDPLRWAFNAALLDCVSGAWEEAFERLRDRGVRGLHHLTPPCATLPADSPVQQMAVKVRDIQCLRQCAHMRAQAML